MLALSNIWSSISFGQISPNLVSTHAFQKIDRSIYKYTCGPRSDIPKTKLPRVRSIGAWSLCGAESAKVCAQWYVCKKKGISDCTNLRPEDEISPLSMQAWTWITSNDPQNYGNPILHRNLNILTYDNRNNPIFQTTFAGLALNNSKKSFSFYSEACYPFDQLANTNKFPSEQAAILALVKAEKFYEENKKKTEGFCEDCFKNEIGSTFGIEFNRGRVANALSSNTFKEFLFELVFSGCRKKVSADPPVFSEFPPVPTGDDPKANLGKFSKEDLNKKISEVLSDPNAPPIALDNICIYRDKSQGNICGYHSLTIAGFDKVCKNQNCTDCRDRVKVHNNWGEDWQKNYTDDGYIDKQSLINNVKDPVESATMSWIY